MPVAPPHCRRTSPAVTYDRRGRGDSGDNPAYEVAREIEDLDAVIQAVGGSQVPTGLLSSVTTPTLVLNSTAALAAFFLKPRQS